MQQVDRQIVTLDIQWVDRQIVTVDIQWVDRQTDRLKYNG
jgi:hypothetical protein